MSALTNEEILEAIKVKPALELSELVKMMEETFGVSAAAPVAVAAVGGGGEAVRSRRRPRSTSCLRASARTRSPSSRSSVS